MYTWLRKKVLSKAIEAYCGLGIIKRRISVDGVPLVFPCHSYGDWRRPRNSYKPFNSEMKWLSGVGKDDIVWDIGANIGAFTLYPAAWMQIHQGSGMVYAFEPEAQNYSKLNENIRINGLSSYAQAFPVAVGSCNRLGKLYVKKSSGGSGHAIDRADFEPDHLQGLLEIPGDTLIQMGVRFPNHIKIDVDGYEMHVIEGMASMLGDDRLQTMHIELDMEKKGPNIIARLKEKGLRVAYGQTWTKYKGAANVVFNRIPPLEELQFGGMDYGAYIGGLS